MRRNRTTEWLGVFLPLLLAASPCASQTYVRDLTSLLFFDDSGVYTEPLSGGINAPMQQFVDIDNDGDFDLFIFDNDYYPVRNFFRNEGTAASPLFVLDLDDAFYTVPFTFWFLFTDYDSDGTLDLLTDDGATGVLVWLNANTPADPVWVSSPDHLLDTTGAPVFAGFASLPGVIDLDGDSLKDFLSSNSADGSFNYYRNVGSEGDPRYALVSTRFENITILGDTCVSSLPRRAFRKEPQHGAGAIAFVDLDSNGTNDILYGDIFSHSLFQIMNIGTAGSPDLECISNYFPPDGSLATVGFNQASFTDIDADGDPDLFVGVLNSRSSGSFWFYRNTGTPSAPDFSLVTMDFIRTLDVGQNAHPAVADLDGDGDRDLVIGNTAGQLRYFRNDGGISTPVFNLADTLFAGISGNYSYAPVFADMNADSLPDLVLGRFDGRVLVYRNQGGGVFTAADSLLAGQYAVPAVGDLDGDGDPDLLVGKSNGTLSYFRNDGDASAFAPVLVTDSLGGIDVGENARPVLLRNDSTGLLDLYVTPAAENPPEGGQSRIFYYFNAGTPQSPVFLLRDDRWGPGVPFEPALAFADLDGDGDGDLLVGTSKGGLQYYRNDPLTGISETAPRPADFVLEQNYPNPFNGSTLIRFSLGRRDHVRLEIFNTAGERLAVLVDAVEGPGRHEARWDATAHPSGVYFYRLSSGTGGTAAKMLFIK